MHLRLYILFILLPCFFACSNNSKTKNAAADTTTITFDTSKWSIKSGDDYPHREALLPWLITGRQLKGWKKDSVLALLGKPNKTDSNYIFYRITQQRFGTIPLHTKTLVIKFTADTMEWRKIHE